MAASDRTSDRILEPDMEGNLSLDAEPAASVAPDPAALAGRIREAGFAAVGWTLVSGGIVAIHTAVKAP